MTLMTDIQAGTDDRRTDDRAKSAADAFAPMKLQTPSSSSWTREDGVQYLVALDVDGTLVDHDGHMSRGVKDSPVSYTHLTLPTIHGSCRSRWSQYH